MVPVEGIGREGERLQPAGRRRLVGRIVSGGASLRHAQFLTDLAVFRATLAFAQRSEKRRVFAEGAAALVRWAEVGACDKADVVDSLAASGVQAGFSDDAIAAAIAAAFAAPLRAYTPPGATLCPPATVRLLTDLGDDPDAIAPGEPTELRLRRASDIVPEPIRWLWPDRIALGKVTMIAGDPGLGKSQLLCALAAAVSRGGEWPCGEGRSPPGNVVILSGEDDPADTIRPRLDAAGADVGKVFILSPIRRDAEGVRVFNLQDDLALLEDAIAAAGDVALVGIDPISSYLGKVDSHRNADLRAVLEPLNEMAARLRVALLATGHLNKAEGGRAISRVNGSIAFVAVARGSYLVVRDPADTARRLFLPAKNNLGPDKDGLAFRIATVPVAEGIVAPRVAWDGRTTLTADEALATATAGAKDGADGPAASGRQSEAEAFLAQLLADGPVAATRVRQEAEERGLAWGTVRRAQDKLKVRPTKPAVGAEWTWSLPPDSRAPPRTML